MDETVWPFEGRREVSLWEASAWVGLPPAQVYAYLVAHGTPVVAEDLNNDGRLDWSEYWLDVR